MTRGELDWCSRLRDYALGRGLDLERFHDGVEVVERERPVGAAADLAERTLWRLEIGEPFDEALIYAIAESLEEVRQRGWCQSRRAWNADASGC
jgi:hypothetical protein